jgi:hypothetical protein
MKKLFVFLLAFLYIGSSCDASVYLHYCMGKQVSVSLSPGKSGNCQRCGMKKSAKGMGCCKDEQKTIKSDKSQKITDLVYSDNQQKRPVSVFLMNAEFLLGTYQASTLSHYPLHGPPAEKTTVPRYVKYCVFLI